MFFKIHCSKESDVDDEFTHYRNSFIELMNEIED